MKKSVRIITVFLIGLLLFSGCGLEKSEVVGDFAKYNCYNANVGDSLETITDTYGIKLSETSEKSAYESNQEFYGEKSKFIYRFTDSGKLSFVDIESKTSGNMDDDELRERYQLLKKSFTELWGEPEEKEDEQGSLISYWGMDDIGVTLRIGNKNEKENEKHVIVLIDYYDFFLM